MSSLFGNGPVASATLSKEELRAQQRRLAGPWLHAWHDPVANVKVTCWLNDVGVLIANRSRRFPPACGSLI
jgi:hypothetical protein